MDQQISNTLLSKIVQIEGTYHALGVDEAAEYNIFTLLKIERKETRLHSKFIADLLNPNSKHGLRETFLRNFIEYFGIEKFEPIGSRVIVEKYVGRVEEESGGRIDILLTDKSERNIIIENKIDAMDQKNQLRRYYNYDQRATIIYLTLDGNSPSEESLGSGPCIEYLKISYKKEILEWLNSCLKEAEKLPVLREIINQYINLIKHLTGQTKFDKMKKEIADLITNNPDYVKAYYNMKQAEELIKTNVLEQINAQLRIIGEQIKMENNEFGIEYIENKDGINAGLYITSKHWPNFKLFVEFKENWDSARYGIQQISNDIQIDQLSLKKLQHNLTNMDYNVALNFLIDKEIGSWRNTWDILIPQISRNEVGDEIYSALVQLIKQVKGVNLQDVSQST